VLYLVTLPGCVACANRKDRLHDEGREFLEVDAEALLAGRDLPLSLLVRSILLAEVMLVEGKLPVEVELP
jgi:hypothetical protein